jgi:hypothetical protein
MLRRGAGCVPRRQSRESSTLVAPVVIAGSLLGNVGTLRHEPHRPDSRGIYRPGGGTPRAVIDRMAKVNRMLALLSMIVLGAGAATVACGGAAETPPLPEPSTEIKNPETGLDVRATIASASLGNGSANVQIAFFATDAKAPASVSITNVVLVDARSGATVDTLAASSPGIWNGHSYESWNEKVTPGGDLRASYTLTAPKWSSIDGDGTRSGSSSSYSTPYKLRVSLRIDGAEVTLESAELEREPEVMT